MLFSVALLTDCLWIRKDVYLVDLFTIDLIFPHTSLRYTDSLYSRLLCLPTSIPCSAWECQTSRSCVPVIRFRISHDNLTAIRHRFWSHLVAITSFLARHWADAHHHLHCLILVGHYTGTRAQNGTNQFAHLICDSSDPTFRGQPLPHSYLKLLNIETTVVHSYCTTDPID